VEAVAIGGVTPDVVVSDTTGFVLGSPLVVVNWTESVEPAPLLRLDEHPTTTLAIITTAKDARASMSHRNEQTSRAISTTLRPVTRVTVELALDALLGTRQSGL
jgi:hypothetical protein